MTNVGDKYVIELDSHMTNKNGDLWGVKGFKSLVFDQNGLDKLTKIREANEEAYQRGYNDGQSKGDKEYETEKEQKAYQQGLEDAWKCMEKIAVIDSSNPFGYMTFNQIIKNYTPQEVINKINEYEKQNIKVGDVVTMTPGINDNPFVVIRVDDEIIHGVEASGLYRGGRKDAADFKKTGRVFPQIAEILKSLE